MCGLLQQAGNSAQLENSGASKQPLSVFFWEWESEGMKEALLAPTESQRLHSTPDRNSRLNADSTPTPPPPQNMSHGQPAAQDAGIEEFGSDVTFLSWCSLY